ncbi:MAG: hypothetical protein ACM3KR_08410, partial [Deltaproteobacteria bacterium]
ELVGLLARITVRTWGFVSVGGPLGYICIILLFLVLISLNPKALLLLSYGEPYHKPFSFCHSPDGTSFLLQHLNELEVITGLRQLLLLLVGNFFVWFLVFGAADNLLKYSIILPFMWSKISLM